MSRLYTTALAMAAGIASFAAVASETTLLTSITGREGTESYYFTYNDQHLLAKEVMDADFYTEKFFTYNEQGQCIREACFQPKWDNPNDTIEAYYLVYLYNDKGQLTNRLNYNSFGETEEENFSLGADMVYSYNEAGQLTEINTYWDQEHTDLYMTETFAYDEDGLLVGSELKNVDFFTHELVPSTESVYLYNADRKIMRKETAVYDLWSGGTSIQIHNFTYNAEGSLEAFIATTDDEDFIIEKREFAYNNSIPASDIVFPYAREEGQRNEFFQLMTRQPITMVSYERDFNGDLGLYDTYDFGYTAASAINAASLDKRGDVVALLRTSEGEICLQGVARGEVVTIYSREFGIRPSPNSLEKTSKK